jgi:hypothetical protein
MEDLYLCHGRDSMQDFVDCPLDVEALYADNSGVAGVS